MKLVTNLTNNTKLNEIHRYKLIKNTLWWKFTAESTHSCVDIKATAKEPDSELWSDYLDGLLWMYEASDPSNWNSFNLLQFNDDENFPYGRDPKIAQQCVVPGNTYYIQFDGNDDTESLRTGIGAGDIFLEAFSVSDCPSECVITDAPTTRPTDAPTACEELTETCPEGGEAPTNDNIANAIELTFDSAKLVQFDNVCATEEEGEVGGIGGKDSVWWKFNKDSYGCIE